MNNLVRCCVYLEVYMGVLEQVWFIVMNIMGWFVSWFLVDQEFLSLESVDQNGVFLYFLCLFGKFVGGVWQFWVEIEVFEKFSIDFVVFDQVVDDMMVYFFRSFLFWVVLVVGFMYILSYLVLVGLQFIQVIGNVCIIFFIFVVVGVIW